MGTAATYGIAAFVALFVSGCGSHETETRTAPPRRPVVVVVAPVLNLSGSSDWDPLKVTDMVASEMQSFPGIVVIPVNRALAALAQAGRFAVETPQDAFDLAAEFDADATVVTAVTEYDPYDPPRVGLLMQWYSRAGSRAMRFDPVSASRQAAEMLPPSGSAADALAPQLQVQRVFDASATEVRNEVRAFGRWRAAHGSPYDWRVYVKSQELFVRYCCWSAIRSMLLERDRFRPRAADGELDEWTDRSGV